MSDIEREKFEQAVTDRWSDSYSFTRFGDEDYYDEVLEGMWWGWQASRQGVEGEPTAIVNDSGVLEWYPPYNRPPAGTKLYTHPVSADDSKHHAVMQAQIWAQEARTQKAIVKEIGEMVGCANDWEMVEAVRDALANVCVSQSAAYETQADLSLMDDKQAVSVPEWIKCSDRLPDVLDVWIKMTDGSVVACWSKLNGDFYWNGGGSESYILENTVTHWKPRQQE